MINILMATLAFSLVANDGSWVQIGSAGQFKPNNQVQMVSEDVKIYLQDESAKISAKFVFKNHGNATTVTMAFPDETYSQASPAIKKLVSKVDGQITKTTYQQIKPQGDDEETDDVKGVWLKTVSFSANQTRTVTVDYEFDLAASVMNDRYLGYVLVTGATWRGNIESCKVTVDWSKVKNYSKPDVRAINPKNFSAISRTLPWKTTGDKQVTFELKDIKPDFDINIRMLKGFWNYRINGNNVSTDAAGYSMYLPYGKGDDIMLPSFMFAGFFGTRINGQWEEWKSSSVKTFGGEFEFFAPDMIIFEDGKLVKLKRHFKQMAYPHNQMDKIDYVYLKDVVIALGGSYQYDAKEDIVNITFPAKK